MIYDGKVVSRYLQKLNSCFNSVPYTIKGMFAKRALKASEGCLCIKLTYGLCMMQCMNVDFKGPVSENIWSLPIFC